MISQTPPSISQNADIRYLGRLLGEIIRRQSGEQVFQRIEAIRAASVDRHRGAAHPREPSDGLDGLSLEEMVAFVRSFMLFSMLANLAEDRQDRALSDTIFARIGAAWMAAHDGLLAVTRQTRLLERHPALEVSIRLRLPYIEPLNLLQVEMLKRHRAGEKDVRLREGIHLSINAIATALRNSG